MMESRFQDEALKQQQQHDVDLKKVLLQLLLQFQFYCVTLMNFLEFRSLLFLFMFSSAILFNLSTLTPPVVTVLMEYGKNIFSISVSNVV